MDAYQPMVHALALRWAARHMTTVLEVVVKEPNPDPLQAVGSLMARVILAALAAEVALKALCKLESGEQPEPIHDLDRLFSGLSEETQRRLDLRFQGIRAARGPRHQAAKTLAQVLYEHRHDFERWRYVYEDAGGSSVELLDLDPAIEAMHQEYASKVAVPAAGDVDEPG